MSLQTSLSSESASLDLAVPFVVTPRLDGDVLTIAISGELDIATVPLVEEAQHSMQGRYQAIRYELAGLGFMDSAGLRVLLAPGGRHVPISQISITHPTRIVRRLFELRGLQGMVDGEH